MATAFTPTAPALIRTSIARDLRIVETPPALTWPDYLGIGRERALADLTRAAASWGRKPDLSQLDRLARVYAEADCPAAVRKAHFAALNGPGDPRFMPAYPMVLAARSTTSHSGEGK